jgi:peptide/nickel transport system ATP-binding protein/oligopeptide transport system ATP-binding protein
LCTYFYTDDGIVKAVDGVNLKIHRGETLGVVGESGCGKSVTALSIMRLIPAPPGRITRGKILYGENKEKSVDLIRLDSRGSKMRNIRGGEIAMIFQEPMISLNPVYTIGNQIIESIMVHQKVTKKEAKEHAIKMLDRVGISDPAQRVDDYPHQLSGGMRQRAMIAMALSCNPSLLIADEPTTALDVTVQAQVLELMKELQQEFGMAIMIITHDLGVIAETSDNVAVMYLGKIMEYASAHDLFHHPMHPYLQALLKSIPSIVGKGERLAMIKGTVPDPLSILRGCLFAPRCSEIKKICQSENEPPVIEVEKGHQVKCWLYA